MSRAPEDVGIIGLGAMGAPMATHLLAAHPGRLHLTAREPARAQALLDAGARWHDTARSVAAATSVLILMLPDLPEVEAVLDGPDGILAADPTDLLLVVSSTSSAEGVRRLAGRLAERHPGVRVVDAPVSGGVDGAAAGSLSIMVGGADGDVARALPVLEACGHPVHLGPLGAGEVAKACNQLIVSATVLALGEAAVLADRSGLDLDALFRLLAGGYAGSRILATRGQRIVDEDYSPSGAAKYMLKDLAVATEVADSTQTDAALLPALRAAFADLVDRGLGDQDMSVTRRYVEQRSADRPA